MLRYHARMLRTGGVSTALFICVAACGDVTAFTDAAPGADAAQADAITVDAVPTGQVTVTTRARCCDLPPDSLVAGVPVLVISADGSVGDSGQTNAQGTITLDIDEGDTVTAVYTTTDGFDLVTVVGVKPGDQLNFGEAFTAPSQGVDGQMTATWPVVAGTYYYLINTPCGNQYVFNETTTSVQVGFSAYCQRPTADFVFTSISNTTYLPQRTAILRNVNFTNGQTAALGAWAVPTNFAVNATALPSYVNDVYFSASAVVGDRQPYGSSSYVTPDAGAASGALPVHVGSDRIATTARLSRPGDLGDQYTYRAVPGSAATTTFATNELPWLGEAYVSAAGNVASWIQVGDQDHDGAIAYASWYRDRPGLFGGPSGSSYSWTIMLPPGVTSWSWAQPPAALAEYVPVVGDTVYGDVALVDLASADGYDGLRATDERIFSCLECATSRGALVGDATVSYGYDGGEGFAAPAPLRAPWRASMPAATPATR